MSVLQATFKRIEHSLPEWTRRGIRRCDKQLPDWARKMIRTQEWQVSTAIAIVVWVISFLVILDMAARLGHRWEIKVAVSFLIDLPVFLISWKKIWANRQADGRRSAVLWFGWWLGFLAFNIGLAWLVMGQTNLRTIYSLLILAFIGVVANPVVFKYRDRIVFKPKTE